MKNRGILVVISGFSGAGKGTMVRRLIEEYDYSLSVSMTTRSPRPGEKDGVDYFYVTRERFEQAIEEDGFIEHAEYCGNYYGTPKEYVEKELSAGRDVILEIEAQGAEQVKASFPEAFLVFIMTPDVATLVDRLNGRGTETAEEIQRRLHRAAEEVDLIEKYDAIIVNDELDEATQRMHSLIQAAKAVVYRNVDFIGSFRIGFDELFKGGKY